MEKTKLRESVNIEPIIEFLNRVLNDFEARKDRVNKSDIEKLQHFVSAPVTQDDVLCFYQFLRKLDFGQTHIYLED